MAGRPQYEPTKADRATVQCLVALGARQEDIAKCIGTWGVTRATLRKHFKREMEISVLEVQANAMAKLVAAINAGEAWAVKFYLERKCGFVDKVSVEASGPDGNPIQLQTRHQIVFGPEEDPLPAKT